MTKFSGSELVACTNTRSVEATPVASAHNSVADEVAATLRLGAVQYPKIKPLIVETSTSSPTLIAEVLAVPTSTKLSAPTVIVPSVAFEIVSLFRSVIRPVELIVVVAVPPKYAVSWTENRVEDACIIEVRPVSVEAPVTLSVPSVETFVLIVVAACTPPTTKRTPATTAIVIAIQLLFLINERVFSISYLLSFIISCNTSSTNEN